MASPVNTRDLILENVNRARFVRNAKTLVGTSYPWTNLFTNPSTPVCTELTASTSSSVLDPYGSAAKLYKPSTNNAAHYLNNVTVTGALVSAQSYQSTIYIKDDGTHYTVLSTITAANAGNTLTSALAYLFYPSTGSVVQYGIGAGWSNVTCAVTSVGSGWWKVIVRGTFSPTQSEVSVRVSWFVCSATGILNYSGDGTSGVYLFGPQGYVNNQPDEVIGDQFVDSTNTIYRWNGYSWYGAAQSAKTISLVNDRQVFTYDSSGSALPAGQYATLSVQKQNTTAAVTWSTSPTVTLYTLSSGGSPTTTGDTVFLRISDFGSNTTVQVTASITDGTTITDTITLGRVQNGTDGTNPVVGFLTNEAALVPSASDGTGYSLTSSGGTFKTYSGSTDVTTSAVYGINTVGTASATQNGLTITINTATGVYSLAGSAWTSDAETFTIVSSYNSIVNTKLFKVTKAKAGATGATGAAGVNGTRTAVLDLYRWGATAPTTWPAGTSTYTWATGSFTAPATLNGWSATPPAAVAGQTLYICRQVYADTGTSATSTVTWSATSALRLTSAGTNGATGANGQRVGVLEVYQWAASAPTTYPSGTSTYTWATGAFTAPTTANGWSLIPGAAVPGQTLWGISVSVSDNLTTSTSTATWNSSTVYAVGAAGAQGPSITITPNRAVSFTSTADTLDAGQPDIILTANTYGISSPTYVWSFTGFQSAPTNSGTSSQVITATQFGTSSSAIVTCTVNGTYVDKITIPRLSLTTNTNQLEDGANLGGTASWSGVDGKPGTDAQLVRNLIDANVWSIGGGTPAGWYANPVSSGGSNTFILDAGPDGSPSIIWRASSGSATTYNAEGGIGGIPYITVDGTKAYRSAVWVRVSNTSGSVYLGATGSSVLQRMDGSVDSNPYEAVISRNYLVPGRWYLMVGYLFPAGTPTQPTTQSGIWDGSTGTKLTNLTIWQDHKFDSAGTSQQVGIRAFQFYTNTSGCIADFCRPRFELLDGSELTIQQLLAPAMATNAQVTAAQLAADTANTNAAIALAKLSDIADDSKLTPIEKHTIRLEWDAIYGEKSGINAQATALGITTENTAYNTQFQALGTYLNDSTAYTIGATAPLWITDANLSVTTAIVGSTFRSMWTSFYTSRQTLMNKLASVASTTSTWSGVAGTGKPEDNATVGATVGIDVKDGQGYVLSSSHLQKNLLDPSRWATGVDGWVNYANVASVGNNTQYAATGCDGTSDLVWQAVGLVGAQYWMGGPQSRSVSIDPSKTYRYCIPIRRTSSNVDSHTIYAGIVQFGSNIDSINTTTLNTNAYFAGLGASSAVLNKWYLLVGYIYPAGSSTNPISDGGLYDCDTGVKTYAVTSFNWHSTATTIAFRHGLYRSSAATQEVKCEFGRPLFQVIDGSESPISDFFASTATYNKSISINSDGSLSGAGTGKVTLTGIGYAVDNDLINSVNCTVSGGRVTKSSGTNAWDSSVYSKTSFKGGAVCSFVVDSLSYSFFVGLNSDPTTDNSYGSIDYAWYIEAGAGTASAWVNGVRVFTDSAFAVGDAYSVAYDGTKVLFSKNGTVKYTHTSGVAADLVLYLDTSFYHVGASASAVKFGGYTSNAWSSIGGTGKPQDNATVGGDASNITSINVGVVSSSVNNGASSGGRVVIDNNTNGRILIYDSSNALRIKIGYLL